VDPIPPQLAAVLASPGPVDVPLDDVVPGDPPRRAILSWRALGVLARWAVPSRPLRW